ncbi:MAG TPA: isoprenylcysteine carboxylmethyltransferase family protein [Candidatus Acidoferrales bacterium]|nr:isoprenylcysteine carboxylmethyltransferase family protein [Candidatus Acidoferrales bacterium]
MNRALGLVYGMLCYVFFLAVFLLSIWFVWTMDGLPARSPLGVALVIDAVLLGLFAVQHSGMARQGFKRVLGKLLPQPVERSTYVFVASAVLFAVIKFWQPAPRTIWNVTSRSGVPILETLFWLGWLQVLVSTFLIDHFDLFGLKQVWRLWRNLPYDAPKFATPGPYRLVRHPIYLGFIVAFWSAPRMTLGHLFFAAMCSAYIILAIQFEERDLITFHGEAYRVYRTGVSMLLPLPAKKR